jgi:hypothetical protein
MYAAGTRVKLLTAVGEHPAGTTGVVVYDLGGDECQIALDSGEPLVVKCAVLAIVETSMSAAD